MKTLNLALQGGGSHGAFTWGVLDALLADGRIAIEGLSGTSAGALNAVALASGHALATSARRPPNDGAREALAQLWDEIGSWGALGSLQAQVGRMLWGSSAALWANAWRDMLSPSQANPLDLNPLRDLLERRVDFAAIRRPGGPKVYVSATHVTTGKAVIFSGARLTPQAVMASACLPTLFRAVEIDGEPYWDGGYSVNPALTPLIKSCASEDILVVQINPLLRDGAPDTQAEILDRVNELTFNASLLTQMRAIDFVNRLMAAGGLPDGQAKAVRLHRIDGGAALQAYGASSKGLADPQLVRELFALGHKAATDWLAKNFNALGHQGTVDVRHDYLDDTSLSWALAKAERPAGEPRRLAFKPWVSRLLKRSAPKG